MKFAIIGAGYIGKIHALGGIIGGQQNDISLEPSFVVRREQTVVPYPYKKYMTVEGCLQAETPAFFDICTPNDNHLAQVEKLAKTGRAIYCEKPLADQKESAEKMLTIAKENGILTGVAFNYRSSPALHLAKQVLEDGLIGNVIHCDAFFLHDSALKGRARCWRNNNESGGGAMIDLGVHLMDMLRFLLGEMSITSAYTHIQFPQNSDVDEHAEGTATTEKGVHVRFVASRLASGGAEDNRIDIFGEKGKLRFRLERPYEVEYYDIASGTTTKLSASTELLAKLHYPSARSGIHFLQATHAASLASFAKSVQQNKKCPWLADFADGYAAQCLVDDFYKMSK